MNNNPAGTSRTIPVWKNTPNARRLRHVRVIAQPPNAFYSEFTEEPAKEIDLYTELSGFERDFLVAFHDICIEFILNVLRKSNIVNVDAAITSGKLNLEMLAIYLEVRAKDIIAGYTRVFPHLGGIDLSSVSLRISYDRSVNDIVCQIAFFRG